MDEEKQVISGCYAFLNFLDVVKDLSEKNKILVIGLVIYSRLTGEEPDLKPYSKHIIPYYRALKNVCTLKKFTGRPKPKAKPQEEDAGLRMIRQIEEEDRRKQNGY